MGIHEQLENAAQALTSAVDRLEKAAGKIAEKQREIDALHAKCGELQSALDRAGDELAQGRKSDADFEKLRAERDELLNARNRLVAEKNQLLGERDQFKKFHAVWERERSALIKAKEDAERETARLKNETASVGGGNGEEERLREELRRVSESEKNLIKEKEGLSIELDGVRRAYEDLKRTAGQASVQLDATLAELKALRG